VAWRAANRQCWRLSILGITQEEMDFRYLVGTVVSFITYHKLRPRLAPYLVAPAPTTTNGAQNLGCAS
jgi:hypothetical protein